MLAVQLASLLLPWRLRRWVLSATLGYTISKTAKIGFSLLVVENLVLGDYSIIGHFNVIRNLKSLDLGEHSIIGNFNWITGETANSIHYGHLVERDPSLYLLRHAAITHRHLIDCSDAVTIGEFSILAGWGSQILSHAIDLNLSRQEAAAVTIGAYCFVGTRSILLKGVTLPDHCVLAAGGVLSSAQNEEWAIYGGVPARKISKIETGAAYFRRENGYVI